MAEEIANTKATSSLGAVGGSLGTAVRVLRSEQGKRIFAGLMSGGSTMFGSFFKVLRALFHQVTGFFFLVIAVGIGSKTYSEYKGFTAGTVPVHKFYIALAFCLMFTYFGLSSFWRSRK
jgi:hypothetical protein